MQMMALIENVVLLIASYYAYRNRGYGTYLVFVGLLIAYMSFDVIMLNAFDIEKSSADYTAYWIATSMFFVGMAGVLLIRITGLSVVFACCMLAQSMMSLLIGINGMSLNGVNLPNYDIIYNIQRVVNSVVWVVEIYALLGVEIRTAGNAIAAKIKIND